MITWTFEGPSGGDPWPSVGRDSWAWRFTLGELGKTVLFDGLNLNDLGLYHLMPGFDPGQSEPSYDEWPSYAGGVTLTNVQAERSVQLTLPVDVRGWCEAAMLAGIEEINARIAACSRTEPKTLVVGSRSFQIIDSAEVAPPEDELRAVNVARLSLILNRLA